MTEPMDPETFRRYADGVRRALEDRVVNELEDSLAVADTATWPPTPGTAHPSLQAHAEFVRRYIQAGNWTVCVPGPPRPLYRALTDPPELDLSELAPTNHITLSVREACGPAPYVGDRYCYTWLVALAPDKRWIAMEADVAFAVAEARL